jgi:hypothetical protein
MNPEQKSVLVVAVSIAAIAAMLIARLHDRFRPGSRTPAVMGVAYAVLAITELLQVTYLAVPGRTAELAAHAMIGAAALSYLVAMRYPHRTLNLVAASLMVIGLSALVICLL